MSAMDQTILNKESTEYLEILSDVFSELVRKAATTYEAQCKGEITHSLAQCLEYIYLHGPSPIRKVAAGLSISDPAASQLVDRLVQKNLVTREHNPNDRRIAKVNLTEEGRELVVEARAARMKWLHEILGAMPAERRKSLADSLEEFIRVALEIRGSVDDACVRCGIDHLAFCIVNKARVSTIGEPVEEY